MRLVIVYALQYACLIFQSAFDCAIGVLYIIICAME